MAMTDKLRAGLKSLRLSTMLQELERLEEDKMADKMPAIKMLDHLVEHEIITRHQRAMDRRIRQANFPEMHQLEEYDFKRMPGLNKQFITMLHGCEWVGKGENIVFCGAHGLGKTHLAISLGTEACEKGYTVLHKKVDELVLELTEARDEARVLSLRRKLQKVDLLICDELGYTAFDRIGGELLHGVLSDRYDARKSVVVTTNLEFGRWVEVFKSKEMTVALLDRLTHRCDVIVMTGESKRREESLARQRQRQTRGQKRTTKS
jgi:DNA replication protein DnaC